MRCSCGKKVLVGDLNAVIIKENSGRIKRVICGNCASFRKIRRVKPEDIKAKPYRKFRPWNIPLDQDELDIIEKAR